MKAKIQLWSSGIALAALLAYTFVHTGSLLARYIQPPQIGFIAAFGIELAVVSLSLRIGDLRKNQKKTGFLFFVLISVVIVSAVANVAEGFREYNSQELSFATIQKLDPMQAVIGLLATGLISLIVLAMSEIIGTDITAVVRKAERDRKKSESDQVEVVGRPTPATEVQAVTKKKTAVSRRKGKRPSKQERKDDLAVYLSENPEASYRMIAADLKISKGTVGNYLDELLDSGQVVKMDGRYHVNGVTK